MPTSLKRWEVAARAPESHFARFPDLEPLIVQILYNRRFTEPQAVRDFLAYRWAENDPFQLKGMAETVDRIRSAIHRRQPIAVYGDYDADGVTATALMTQTLKALGANVRAYIPDRFDEGYGLNNEALHKLAGEGIQLIITVDCGIRSVAEVAYANSLGLDVIITDHHSVGDQLPPALAAINPKQPDCAYTYKDLAGVGLAYKVAQALLQGDLPPVKSGLQAEDLLDLVALGTVADLAPLHGENRHLVEAGLRRLNHQPLRPGLAALRRQIGLDKAISAGTIGFVLGPRLNAAGRLVHAWAAYNLLVAATEFEAINLARQLDLQNQERQNLTAKTVEAARQVILADEVRQPLYFIHQPGFNPGIVGLVASRLTEEFYRPTLVAEQGPEQTKGSARSIPEFHITQALDQCAGLLVRHGGHAAAAGFTVKNENLPALQEQLHHIAARQLQVEALRPTIKIDAEIKLRYVKPHLVEAINTLQPFGHGNTTPCFMTPGLQVRHVAAIGQEGHHLRLVLHDGRQTWRAIAFRQGARARELAPGQMIDLVYHLEFNEWQGTREMQLNVKDLRPGE